jgi:hypothetical protein
MIPCTTRTDGRPEVPRPPTGKTPPRTVRIGDEIWEHVKLAAAEDGTTPSAVVVEALREYIAKRARQRRAQQSKGESLDG